MGDVAPESGVICYFLLGQENALAGEGEVHEGGREAADCADGVEVADGDAEGADVKIGGVFGGEFHYSVADSSVEETDADGGGETSSARLDGGQGECALEDVLGCFAGFPLVSYWGKKGQETSYGQ